MGSSTSNLVPIGDYDQSLTPAPKGSIPEPEVALICRWWAILFWNRTTQEVVTELKSEELL